jgi:hypothetical protein
VQKQLVDEPGFGATFYDSSGPAAELTYRVCSVDPAQGPLCGAPFTTYGPVFCGCEPTDCATQSACFTTLDDGCGNTLHCGACRSGVACNPDNNSCCPAGQQPDGWDGCECAPPTPCGRGEYWDPHSCTCESIF